MARVTNLSRALEELKEAGLWVVAADSGGGPGALGRPGWTARWRWSSGAEGAGVRPGVLKHCDLRLRIPMAGQVASLNASVSAALLLYEVARQRAAAAGAFALTPAKSVP